MKRLDQSQLRTTRNVTFTVGEFLARGWTNGELLEFTDPAIKPIQSAVFKMHITDQNGEPWPLNEVEGLGGDEKTWAKFKEAAHRDCHACDRLLENIRKGESPLLEPLTPWPRTSEVMSGSNPIRLDGSQPESARMEMSDNTVEGLGGEQLWFETPSHFVKDAELERDAWRIVAIIGWICLCCALVAFGFLAGKP